ncbi:regulatory protein RecX [Novosphingobium sp. ERN07]|uniref:regulatory protein RecX n=1 Tax=Novosphingobium sp. ERN07 TaxID=2726187 RepID=UPI001F0E2D73|nr:RecX family transcriptional regulator [Novosphingobium sp. ERN07]
MGRKDRHPREKRAPRPLTRQKLDELALSYVARFATSAGKLSDYLRRKLRERGWEGEGEPDIDAIVTRFTDLGYIDDAVFARGKAQGLLRRGYGARRIDQALGAAGIAEPLREEARGTERERRHAALIMARKRRFGPFGVREEGARLDPAVREKQVAAMLRAGHPLALVREVVNAVSQQALEEWIDEAGD